MKKQKKKKKKNHDLFRDFEVQNCKSFERVSIKKKIFLLKNCIFQGVIEFSLCLFFAKLVSYTFLYWLPTFIGESGKL